jgi:lysylphosphatidylglycerol synthetase-like protein (DUF2156 family)
MQIVGNVVFACVVATYFVSAYLQLKPHYWRYKMGLPRREFVRAVLGWIVGLVALVGLAVIMASLHWIGGAE